MKARRLVFPLLAGLLFVFPGSTPICAQSPEEWVQENLPRLVKLYVHFHRNPELSFHEQQTALRVGQELEQAGCTVTPEVGGFGVVGILKNGPGPVIMLRGDMDALPISERTGRPYASQVEVADDAGVTVGVMHACGHDIHMTSLVGTAQFLSANKSMWQGTIVFVGQPAEERGSGASAMLDDGLFTRFPKPEACLALHVSPELPAGQVGIRPGYIMANVDSVDITFHGVGGHGAYPHTAIDPIVQAARFVMDVQTMVSREVDPRDPAVITAGSIHGGTKHNIIPDQCHLQLTVRSYSDEVRQLLLEGISRKAQASAASSRAAEPTISVSEGTPSLYNDDELTGRLSGALADKLGESAVQPVEPVMAGEDFSQYSRRGEIPGMLFWLGTVEQERLDRYQKLGLPVPGLHSAEYWPDPEPALSTGIAALSYAAMELLKKQAADN